MTDSPFDAHGPASRLGDPPPLAPLDLPPARVRIDSVPSGVVDLTGVESDRSPIPSLARALPLDWLSRLEEAGEEVFIAASHATLTRRDAGRFADTVAQGLIDRGIDRGETVLVASSNAIDSTVLILGCWRAGCPAALPPTMLSDIVAAPPRLVFCDTRMEAEKLASTLEQVGRHEVEMRIGGDGMRILMRSEITGEVGDRMRTVLPDRPALLWPEDRGAPLIVTHRNLAAKQAALSAAWPFLARQTHVVATTSPPSDAGAGTEALLVALARGGRLIHLNVRGNLALLHGTLDRAACAGPTILIDRPRGLEQLLDIAAEDAVLADRLFGDLQAAVALGPVPESLLSRWDGHGRRARGERVPLLAGWSNGVGAGLMTWRRIVAGGDGAIGLPLPAMEVRLVPGAGGVAGSLGLRGPAVSPGRWRMPTGDPDRRDADGFWRSGRAGGFLDPREPARGLRLLP